MKTRFYSVTDIQKLTRHVGLDNLMDQMIERLTLALQQYDPKQVTIPARSGFHYQRPANGLLEWMPIMTHNAAATIKIVGYHPDNPKTFNLPTIISTLSNYDTHTGLLTDIVDGTFLTALRTGAASAIASQLLAKPDSHSLGLIGCGAQAVTQLHALSRVFNLDTIYLFDSNQTVSHSFSQRIELLKLKNINIIPTDLTCLIEKSDIVCTATTVNVGAGPVLPDQNLRPWLHVNAIGSDFPGKTELPKTLLSRSFVCPDFKQQAIKEGECQQLQDDQIGLGFAHIVQNLSVKNELQQKLTVFDSTGWALEDQVAIQLLRTYADELKLGTEIKLQVLPDDPLNPYQIYQPTIDLAFSNTGS